MKRVILFTDCLGAGGAQRQLVGLAVMLKEIGYDVKVCYYHDSPFYYQYLDDHSVQRELISGAANHVKRIPTLIRYFKKQNPNWIIAYQESPSTFACIAKIIGGKFKLMVSERSTTQKMTWREHVRFFLYRWADVIVPNSHSQGHLLAKRYPWMWSRLAVITNFVDLERFYPLDHQRRETPIIMIAASIWPSKNALGLIEAVRMLKDRGVKCKIHWYGKTEKWLSLFNECNAKVQKYGLQEMIELLPKTLEIQKKYQEADYFCLPSFYEGTPNVICEAMSCGQIVVCSNVCDNAIYVREGENGFLFDPKSSVDIADKIQKAVEMSDDDYEKYRRNSRIIAENLLSKELFLKRYRELIEG